MRNSPVLCIIHTAVLHGGFELIEEFLHSAGDRERQNPKRRFQGVEVRVRHSFGQVHYAALARFQLPIAKSDLDGSFQDVHNLIFMSMHMKSIPAFGVELCFEKIVATSSLLA